MVDNRDSHHPDYTKVELTPVLEGDTMSLPTSDGTSYIRQRAATDGIHIRTEWGAAFVSAVELRTALDELALRRQAEIRVIPGHDDFELAAWCTECDEPRQSCGHTTGELKDT